MRHQSLGALCKTISHRECAAKEYCDRTASEQPVAAAGRARALELIVEAACGARRTTADQLDLVLELRGMRLPGAESMLVTSPQ